jgi:hypothetical protein
LRALEGSAGNGICCICQASASLNSVSVKLRMIEICIPNQISRDDVTSRHIRPVTEPNI